MDANRYYDSRNKTYNTMIDEYSTTMKPFIKSNDFDQDAFNIGLLDYERATQEEMAHKAAEKERRKLESDQMMQDYYDMGFAGGGIAGLSGGKRFGPPPESGPVPYGGGLSTMFNRVKPW